MSLNELFMQRAALEHQNMLNSDNAGIILQSLAQGVASGIEQQQAIVQEQREKEKKFKQEVSTFNKKEKIKHKYQLERKNIENSSPIKTAQAKYYEQMSDLLSQYESNSGVSIQGGEPSIGINKSDKLDERDYITTTETRNVRGIPMQMEVRKPKQILPGNLEKSFVAISRTENSLKRNLNMLEENKDDFSKRMTPFNPQAHRGGSLIGGIGELTIKLDPSSSKFATFKAETDKTFQEFRKETTGAQAALKELGWLSPDYPEATDNPELYIAKAKEAMVRIQEAKELLKKVWSPSYRVSHLDNIGNELSSSEEPISNQQQDWDKSKEDRYQELLRKRGGKNGLN